MDSKGVEHYTKIDILDLNFNDLVFNTFPREFKIDLTLIIVTQSNGKIQIFNLLSDSELQ